MLRHHHLAREVIAPQQQAVACRLHVELVAELFDRGKRAGGDEGTVETLVARFELVHIGPFDAAQAMIEAFQQVIAGDDLVLPVGIAVLDGELHRLDLDELARARDVERDARR